MPKPVPVMIGRWYHVPAALRGTCIRRHESVTDGTEIAVAGEAQYFNGKFFQGSGRIGFYMPCGHAGCGSYAWYETNILI